MVFCSDKIVDFVVTRPHPFHGFSVIRRPGLATINLPTKFEVSIFTHYEDMKRDSKCGKWGGLGKLGVTQAH